jgi:hypothetical protein
MEYFEADLTYHDYEIAIEYPELTDGVALSRFTRCTAYILFLV